MKSINMSYYDKFWSPLYDLPFGISPTFEQIESLMPQFIKNVKDFLSEKKEYADLLLEYWFSSKEYPKFDFFPKEMVEFLWRKEVKLENYLGIIRVIDLDSIPYVERPE
jgi:hypothetical protein